MDSEDNYIIKYTEINLVFPSTHVFFCLLYIGLQDSKGHVTIQRTL
jgi:hypothetical protein